MAFQIVYPIVATIDGDSFKDAIKNYVKLNYDYNLTSIIITDQMRYMKANLNYYKDNSKQKVGISLAPTIWPMITSNNEIVSPLSRWPYTTGVSYDTTEYPASTFLDMSDFTPRIIPVAPFSPFASRTMLSPLSPLGVGLAPLSPLGVGLPGLSPFGFGPTMINYTLSAEKKDN